MSYTAAAINARSRHETNPQTDRIDREIAIAGAVADALGEMYPDAVGRTFIADHTHEELSPGAASVAWEGSHEHWVHDAPDSVEFRALGKLLGIWFEPVSSCILAIYPV